MSPHQISKNVLLIFHRDIMYKPIIFHATKKYDILFNVLEAKILHKQEGRLVLQLEGEQEQVEKAIEYMEQEQVKVEELADRIKRDTEKCVHCGACTGVCKAGALWIERPSMEVMFDPERCVACGQCQLACPVQAVSMASIDMDIPA
jgi:ferredoxin